MLYSPMVALLSLRLRGVWCPGFISNLLIGAFSAFASWAFYGSGAGVDISASSRANFD